MLYKAAVSYAVMQQLCSVTALGRGLMVYYTTEQCSVNILLLLRVRVSVGGGPVVRRLHLV